MSNVYWQCDSCGELYDLKATYCIKCGGDNINCETENGPDGKDGNLENIADDDIDEILLLIKAHELGGLDAQIH